MIRSIAQRQELKGGGHHQYVDHKLMPVNAHNYWTFIDFQHEEEGDEKCNF